MSSRLVILVVDVNSQPAVPLPGDISAGFSWVWASPGDELDELVALHAPGVIIYSSEALLSGQVPAGAGMSGSGIPMFVDSVPFSEATWDALGRLAGVRTNEDAGGEEGRARELMPMPPADDSLDAFEELLIRYEYQSRVFDYIASTTPDFIYVFDLEGRFIYANRQLLTVWGRELADCVGKTCLELGYEPWHHEMHMREIAQVIETGQPVRGEVPFRAPLTGIFGVYEYIFTPVISPEGKVEAIAGTTRDVTERKEIVENLRTSKELMEVALVASGTGTFRWDPSTGDFLAMDQSFRDIFGVPEGDEIKTADDVFSRIHPDDVSAVIRAVEGVSRGEEFELEFRIVRPDGSITWVFDRARATYDHQGNILQVIGAVTDITKLKETEQDLRAAERHRQFVMESMPQKIFLADAEGSVYYFNQVWVGFSGLDLEELKNWQRFIHPSDLERTERAWREAVSSGRPLYIEHRFRAADGTFRWHVSRAQSMRDEEGNVQFWIGSCTDVDDMKSAQWALEEREDRLATLNLELQKARDEAVAASAAKSMFLASMSHELRTPLNAIIGYSEMLSEELAASGNDGMAADVNKVLLSGKHLLGVISDILDISKIEAGKMEFDVEPFDVHEVVGEAIVLVAPLMEKNLNEVEVVCAPDDPLVISSDRVRFRQILFNLLSNAAKFTDQGVVRVTCTSGLSPDGVYYAEIAVADSGIGIREDMLENIFQDFSQLKGDRNRMLGGTGLGLAISRRLCQLLGGEIDVESEEGRGSVFTVRLPVVNDFLQCRLSKNENQLNAPAHPEAATDVPD